MGSSGVVLLLVLVGLSTAHASSFLKYENTNNVYGRAAFKANSSGVTFLGAFASPTQCEEACDKYTECKSWVWHGIQGEWYSLCYATTDYFWAPTFEYNVTSGQRNPAEIVTPCESAADCSHNGQCVASKCRCAPQWMGYHCSQLRVVPTIHTAGLQSRDTKGRVSSWGGSVLRDDDGVYHMWAAEMQDSCGIRVWLTNSAIRHATSRDPLREGFTPQELVWGVFAHEPTVARAPTGEFVMFFTASFPPDIPCTNHTCTRCSDGVTPNDGSCPNDQQCHVPVPLRSYMSYAAKPSGPWSKPQLIPSPNQGDTNLAPIINDDGSLLGLGRPPYVWSSPDWKDTTKYTFWKSTGTGGEDPFLWREGAVLHALFHGGGWNYPAGYHYTSVDEGKTWDSTGIHAYSPQMTYLDGTSHSMSRRERPHLVFNGSNIPIAITNGVTPVWACDAPMNCPNDYCYTGLQALAQE